MKTDKQKKRNRGMGGAALNTLLCVGMFVMLILVSISSASSSVGNYDDPDCDKSSNVNSYYHADDGISAEIVDFRPPIGTYAAGSPVHTEVDVKNTGSESKTFWIGLSYRYHGSTSNDDWINVEPCSTSSISPGNIDTIIFDFTLTDTAETYDIITKIWDGYDGTYMIAPEHDEEIVENAFTISKAEIIDFRQPTGTYAAESPAHAEVDVKNTGSESKTFWIGLSYRYHGSTSDYDWIDVEPCSTSSISPGNTDTIIFDFTLTDTAETYDIITKIWDGYDGTYIIAPGYDEVIVENAFTISKAEIIDFRPPTGTYAAGSPAHVEVDVKNTGSESKTFWIGLSYRYHGSTSGDDWIDVEPCSTSSISPGNTDTMIFDFTLTDTAETYDIITKIWDGYDGTYMIAPGYGEVIVENAFTISKAEIIDFRPPNGTYAAENPAHAEVNVKNTGSKSKTFWIGLSYRYHGSTSGDDWIDVEPCSTSSISPENTETIIFDFRLTDTAETYDIITKIWDGYDGTYMIAPGYDEVIVENAFTISKAEIIDFRPPNGTYAAESPAHAEVNVKNTGSKSKTFWVGLSYRYHGSTSGDDWIDVEPCSTSSISPGNTETIIFNFTLTDTAETYDIITKIWDGYDGTYMITPGYDEVIVENAFTIAKAEIIDFRPPNGTYAAESPAHVEVDVKNTGSESKTFWIGLSYRYHGSTSGDDWIDVEPCSTSSISPGNTETIIFDFTLTDTAGTYDIITKIWDGYDGTYMIAPRYDEVIVENAFTISPVKGYSIWIYGIESSYVTAISNYNNIAPTNNQIKYLFCRVGGLDLSSQQVDGYDKSVTSFYKEKLPDCRVYPMLDASDELDHLSHLTSDELDTLAQNIADKINNDSSSDGIHLDIEPYNDKLIDLVDKLNNKTSKPVTVAIGTATSPKQELFTSASIVVLMDYDINTNPSVYKVSAKQHANNFLHMATSAGGYGMIGLPAIATHHEYEHRINKNNGTEDKSGCIMIDYLIPGIIGVNDAVTNNGDEHYIGISIWSLINEPIGLYDDGDWKYYPYEITDDEWRLLEGVNANITSWSVASGTFGPGDMVEATITVENIGDVGHAFYVGYSVYDPNGNYVEGDYDAPFASVYLEPGDVLTQYLTWTVPSDVMSGYWDATVAVWYKEEDGILQGEYNRKTEDDAFFVQFPFTFVHMTDVHIGNDDIPILGEIPIIGRNMVESIELFTDTLQAIKNEKHTPEFILSSGDLVEYGNPDYFQAYVNISKTIIDDIPVYNIPGNHDRRIKNTIDVLSNSLEMYYDHIQPPPSNATLIDHEVFKDYYFNKHGYCFIGLDSGGDYGTLTKIDPTPEGRGLDDDQLKKLGEMEELIGRKIIFMHHPAIDESKDVITGDTCEDDYGNNGCIASNRCEFIKYCIDNNVDLVLTGHTHEDYETTVSNGTHKTQFIQTRSATKGDHGYRVINITKEGILNAIEKTPPDYSRDTFTLSLACFSNKPEVIWGISLYDSSGRHTGMEKETGMIEREIPDSYYTGHYGRPPDSDDIYQVLVVYPENIWSEVSLHTFKPGKTLSDSIQEGSTSSQKIHLNFTMSRQIENKTIEYIYENISLSRDSIASVNFSVANINYTMELDYNNDGIIDNTTKPTSIQLVRQHHIIVRDEER